MPLDGMYGRREKQKLETKPEPWGRDAEGGEDNGRGELGGGDGVCCFGCVMLYWTRRWECQETIVGMHLEFW